MADSSQYSSSGMLDSMLPSWAVSMCLLGSGCRTSNRLLSIAIAAGLLPPGGLGVTKANL